MYPGVEELWKKILESLKAQVGKTTFERWLRTIRPVELTADRLVLSAPSAFARDCLERRAKNLIEQDASSLLERPIAVEFSIAQLDLSLDQRAARHHSSSDSADVTHVAATPLNSKYTFDNFVVGQSNRFAQAAALAVAKAPGKAYNPLFLYGGVGLGKTHLMHAVGHFVRQHRPEINVFYISGDQFTYDVVTSIREDRWSSFRKRYRDVDVWLVDDIQFIAAKERTEAEFFQTFNALHETNKQIVISSDRTPKELQVMDERLQSRFEWGLIADIKPPDLETRIAILQRKAQQQGISLPEDVARYTATAVQSNIRTLEGALMKMIAASSFFQVPMTLSLAMEQLKDHAEADRTKPVSVAVIQQVVAQHFQITVDDLNAKRRTSELAFARHVAMYLCRELAKSSFPEIARKFGGRDHATVIHACRKISRCIKEDPRVSAVVSEIAQRLGAAL